VLDSKLSLLSANTEGQIAILNPTGLTKLVINRLLTDFFLTLPKMDIKVLSCPKLCLLKELCFVLRVFTGFSLFVCSFVKSGLLLG